MGTYTTNYNLFMPSIGEQGWGDLVNGNFTTIDTTMNSLNTKVGTLETEMDAVEEKVTALEPLSIIQVDSNKNVTFPAGITAIGGITFNTVTVSPSNDSFGLTMGSSNYVSGMFHICPCVPGVLYTGTVKYKLYSSSSNRLTIMILSSSDTWSIASLPAGGTDSKTYTFANAKCVQIQWNTNSSLDYIYLPIYS